ncbi:SET domain-containing protein [Artomyces pyxidatus]|uniref:SET domain-containing protein n=1 Tax=Artomyces pyxidatus TaxID=48021 RepID=A0ACB8T4M5_9AGAM|nr:SET domain-containing protein [Artomyces pyxidatus]
MRRGRKARPRQNQRPQLSAAGPSSTVVDTALRFGNPLSTQPSSLPLVPVPDDCVRNFPKPSIASTSEPDEDEIFMVRVPGKVTDDALDTVSLCVLYPAVKAALQTRRIIPLVTDKQRDGRYTIADVPGHGKGILATDNFALGELILHERPLLVTPIIPPSCTLGSHTMEDYTFWDALAKELPDRNREALLDLFNCIPESSSSPGALDDIISTNSLGIRLCPGQLGTHAAVGERASRINHSCSPNAHVHWNADSFSIEVRANRPIAKGDEITVAYLDVLVPYHERQNDLQRKWRFSCACAACSQPGPRESSDERREGFLILHCFPAQDTLMDRWLASSDPSTTSPLKLYHILAENLEQEKLYGPELWLPLCRQLVKAYCAVKDKLNARAWAEGAARFNFAFCGTDGGWPLVASSPERTEWWGLRDKTSS